MILSTATVFIVARKTTKEAIPALKRRISDVVYRRLVADARRRSI